MDNLIGKIHRGAFPLCVEKARLITESFKQTEGEPSITRHAKAYSHFLENMPVLINDYELFVLEGASKPWGAEIDPFLGVWKEDEIRGAIADGIVTVDEKDWPAIRELGKYWETRCQEFINGKIFDERIFKYLQLGVTLPPMKNKNEFRGAYAGSGLCLSFAFTDCYTNYVTWLKGLNSLIKEGEEELKNLRYLTRDAIDKKLYIEAQIMVMKSVIKLAENYANEAEKMAKTEKDAKRKAQLLRIAEACRHVPANAPRSFFEAMQSLWFIQVLNNPSSTHNIGRFDQFMYPYYKKDIAEGKITKEEVLDLLLELRVKCMRPENIKLSSAKRAQHAGFAKWRNMTIGGVTPEGKDATNELTYLVLEAANRLRTPHHTITMRVHEGTPDDLMVKAMEVVKTGIGMPAICLDKSNLEYMTSGGVPLAEARDYCLVGCVDPAVPGRASFLAGSFFTVTKIFEIFLNNGIDPRTGMEAGPFKPKVEEYKTYAELYQGFLEFVAHFISLFHEHSFLTMGFSRGMPTYYDAVEILETVTAYDGMKKGKPISKWPAVYPYDFRAVMIPVGAINVVDGLAAMKKLIFDEKKVTMKQLKEAMSKNWEGYEDIRKMCLQAPKYGNDIDYVDSIAHDLYRFIIDEEAKYGTPSRPVGGKLRGVGGASISSMFAGGTIIGATPDGRMAGTTLSDGTMSSSQGMDTHGPTAMLKSAAKIDQDMCSSTLLNMKLHPSSVKTREDLVKLGNMIKAYADIGGKWIQFNVVGNEELIDAQKIPEKHKDLIVRVAGYSAYFVDLGKGVQDDIIRRMEVNI